MQYELKKEGGFEFIDAGKGEPLLLLHGLFGALSNWNSVLDDFSPHYRVLIPLMPIYAETDVEPSVEGLTDFIINFIAQQKLKNIHVVGNSLGGHVGLTLALRQPHVVETLTLTGSSGLFEEGMGSGFPRRGDYGYVKERVEFTFYSPQTATKELVDEVFGIVNNSYAALRVLKIARAAQRMNMREDVKSITAPTCLIWGLNDNITPVYVAHEFNRLITHTELNFIDHCGHAPMMEQPERFNRILNQFLLNQN